ncbi:MAG: hypothetical protein RLZZ215_744 [Pseudomonadota bacterium]
MKKTPVYLASFLLISLLSFQAKAGLLLNGELSHEYTTQAGQHLLGHLELHNNGTEPIEVILTQEDSAPDGTAHSHERSNRSWVNLAQERIRLEPGLTQQVSYTLTVPSGLREGTYWSGINVEPIQAETKTRPAPAGQIRFGIKQKVRYSVSIMTHLGQGSGKIVFGKPLIRPAKDGSKQLVLKLANHGLFHSRPTVALEVFDPRGQSLGTWQGNKRGLYPGASKTFEIALHNLKAGQYKALLVAEDSNSGHTYGADMNLNLQ